MFTDRTVTVLTAATGHANLSRCIESVQRQTYAQTEHLILIDGPERDQPVRRAVSAINAIKTIHLLTLPEITGLDGWNGHRIYAAGSFLCNTEFICFLNENRWFEPDHVQSLLSAIDAEKAPWAFASVNEADPPADANCFMVRRVAAVLSAPAWYVPGPSIPDAAIRDLLLEHLPKPATNGRQTVHSSAANDGMQ